MAALTAHQHLNWQSSPQQSMAKAYHTDSTAEPGNEALNSMSQVASRPWADNIELWGGRACIVTSSQGPNELLPTRCQPTETAMDALRRDDLLPPLPQSNGAGNLCSPRRETLPFLPDSNTDRRPTPEAEHAVPLLRKRDAGRTPTPLPSQAPWHSYTRAGSASRRKRRSRSPPKGRKPKQRRTVGLPESQTTRTMVG